MQSYIATHWLWLAAIVDVVLATAVTVHAVLRKRDSRSIIAWVGLAWLSPLVGSLIYYCFGINRIQRKALKLQLRRTWRDRRRPTSEASCSSREVPLESRDQQIVLGGKVTGLSLLSGNKIEPLIDGDEAYPAMLESIRRAEHSIALLSYIFSHDRAGIAFRDALLDAQRRGIEIRVLIDDVGSGFSRPKMVSELRKAGIPAASFLSTRVPRLLNYANLRNHRKILVIDGNKGFTGGTNIYEGHYLGLAPKFPVQCLHFALEGPIVGHLQEAFAIDWAFTTGELLHGDAWFPEISTAGPVSARGIAHGPDEDFERLVDIILCALSVAQTRVRIATPYFLPETALIKSLAIAAMRGVAVEIILPSRNDVPIVQWAATALLWQLLEKHCRIFYAEPPFDHTKLMIVDDKWTLIGSSNWDPRSLRLNFEFNVECYDQGLATAMNNIFETKLCRSREVTMQDVECRSLPVKLRDGLARLLSPYM